MAADIIWYLTIFGCAALFTGIGVYAWKLEKPMWFWSGTTVNPDTITDIKSYNRENARMWILYSLWYWAGGIAWIWSHAVALTALILSCTLGMIILVTIFRKIEKKYQKTCL